MNWLEFKKVENQKPTLHSSLIKKSWQKKYIRERESKEVRGFFLVYLKEIRFFHWIFQRVVAKMMMMIVWLREGCWLTLRVLPYETTTITFFYSLIMHTHVLQQIIIKRVRIWDCLTYSLAALQILIRDRSTPGLDSSSMG